MAEFCYECYKEVLKGEKSKNELVISKDLDLCENCGEYKYVVIRYKNPLKSFILQLFKK